ncbi:MAG: hypothetical protein JNM75_10575 [Rhodospirillales bacterium]|nr:hypothetical protein [Rhodospirillales bacterium]
MNTNANPRPAGSERPISYEAAVASVDAIIAEARRYRAQELNRLLRGGLRRVGRVTFSLMAPVFGWSRRRIEPRPPLERQASLAAYVRALRADAKIGC